MYKNKRPNILFILADDMGAWALNCAGNRDIHTPNLDRISNNGIRFENFFCTSPVCSPARASILTGTMPSYHGVLDWLSGGNVDAENPFVKNKSEFCNETIPIRYLENLTTYTDLLADNGYRCCLSGKWHLGDSLNPQHGFKDWYTIARGGCRYFKPEIVQNNNIRYEDKYVTDLIGEYAKEKIEEYSKYKEPFYISVHFTAPHDPWEESDHKKEFLDLYRDCDFKYTPDLPLNKNQVHTCSYGTGERRKDLLRGYYASITAMDYQIGTMIDKLKELDILEDTIIIFTSDNGMNLGHHGIWGKGNGTFPQNMYDTSVKVPFLIMWESHINKNQICKEMFSHYDILPTICELAQIPMKLNQSIPGQSFVQWLNYPEKSIKSSVVVYDEYGPVRMIRNHNWKLVLRYPYGPNEFYNLLDDPNEDNNLYYNNKYDDNIYYMRKEMEEWFLKYSDPKIDAKSEAVTGTGQYCKAGQYAHLKQKYDGVPKLVIDNR